MTTNTTPSVADALDVAMSKACIHSWDQSQFTSGDCDAVHPMFSRAFEAGYRAALSAAQDAQAVPDGIPLNIIRKWPDGFNDRLQHVWLDVVSLIPSVKLYDLQRVLAEFGLRMEVYEDAPAAPAAPQPAQQKGASNG